MKKTTQLFLALILGSLFGAVLHSQAQEPWMIGLTTYIIEPIGQLFLRLIFMVVVPMVFSGLVIGVNQLGQHQDLGKVVRQTLIFTILASTASVLIGVGLVSTLQPGKYFNAQILDSQDASTQIQKIEGNANSAKPFTQSILEIIPKNPIESAMKAFEGEMLSLMFFALILGYALSQISKSQKESAFLKILEDIYEACLFIVALGMKLAPAAVFCLVFTSSLKFGYQILISLAAYAGVVIIGLLIQNFGVYAIMLKVLAKRSPKKFFQDVREVLIYAFATASSNATLPQALKAAEENLKLSPAVSRFVLTVGSTANQNGTALFEGITVLFLAQVYGIDLSISQQIQVVVMSIIAGIGTAGVPGGSLPLIMILLRQVGVPPEGLGLILGVDRFLDMARTSVNVCGDLVIATIVDKKSGNHK